MGFDPVVPAEINGSGPEIRLQQSEAFFDFPAALIDFDDGRSLILQIGADGIESIVGFFGCNDLRVDAVGLVLGDFPVIGSCRHRNEPLKIVCAVLFQGSGSRFHQSDGPLDLPASDASLVFLVFQGIGDDQLLLQPVLLDPPFFVEGSVPVGVYGLAAFFQLPEIKDFRGSCQGPSLRVQGPFLQMLFQLFKRLGGNEGPVFFVVKFSVLGGRQPGIGADDEPG